MLKLLCMQIKTSTKHKTSRTRHHHHPHPLVPSLLTPLSFCVDNNLKKFAILPSYAGSLSITSRQYGFKVNMYIRKLKG